MSISEIDIQPVHCLIVEDDIQSLELITDVLKRGFKHLNLYTAKNLEEAEKLFLIHRPQLLLLDINLPDGNSFELLETLYQHKESDFKVIFITAFADYAVEAFKYSALDFLLKPYLPKELEDTVAQVLDTLKQETYHLQLEAFFQNYKLEENNAKKNIVLKTAENIHVIKAMQIYHVQADSNYTRFFLGKSQRLVVSKPLKVFEEKLAPLGFLRVHQSHLVNIQYVKTYHKKEQLLILTNDIRIPVSNSKKGRLMAYLNDL